MSFSLKFEIFQNTWPLFLERATVKIEEILEIAELRNMEIAGSVFRFAPNKCTPWTQDVN